MNTPHIPVLIVGGGQAGLSVSWCLKQRGIAHVVLEKTPRDARLARAPLGQLLPRHAQLAVPAARLALPRRRSARLHDQARDPGLPGRLPAPRGAAAARRRGRAARAAARRGRLRGRTPAPATAPPTRWWWPAAATTAHRAALGRGAAGRGAADPLRAVPQPAQLPPGAVLVVGCGQSGAQIAEDLHLAGRPGAPGHRPGAALRPLLPRPRRGRLAGRHALLRDAGDPAPAARGCARQHQPLRHRPRRRARHRPAPLCARRPAALRPGSTVTPTGTLRFQPNLREHLDEADRIYNGINASIDRHIEAQGLAAPPGGVYTPVWAAGRRNARRWTCAPPASPAWSGASASGPTSAGCRRRCSTAAASPCTRARLTAVPGLSFIGLPWLHTWGSGRFSGVAADAEHLADQLERAVAVAA